jgi:hypothetical protein
MTIDSDGLIDAMLAEHSRQGIKSSENLREQTRLIINSMTDIWHFRLAKLMERILPAVILETTRERIEQELDCQEDCEILADHHQALGEIHMLIAEYLKTMRNRPVVN